MSEVTREEFDYKHKEIRENVNKLGQTMREAVKDARETASINLKEFKTTDFKSILSIAFHTDLKSSLVNSLCSLKSVVLNSFRWSQVSK